MPKDEWGVKRVCQECQTRFYDLRNDPMTCPACGAEMSVDALTSDKPRVEKTAAAAAAATPKPAEEAPAETSEDVLDDGDDIEVDDELLDTDEDEDNVSLEEIADVSTEDEES